MLLSSNSFNLSYLEDTQGRHTIETIQKLEFNRSIESRFSLGYRPKAHLHWFAIDIEPTLKDRELMLYFTNLFAKEFTFYYKDSHGKWQKKETGYNENNRSKSIWTSKPTLKFSTEYNQRIYAKIVSDVAIVGEFLLFSSLGELIDYQSHHYLFFALFYGVLLMAMGITLFLFITLREPIYGYFLGYLLFTGSFVFMVNSLHSPFATSQIVHTFRMLTPVTVIFYVLFSKELLEIKRVAPRLNLLFNLILLSMLFFMVMINYSTSPWYGLLVRSSTLLYTLLLIGTVVAIYYRINKARVFLFALILNFISSWMMSSMYNGSLENNDINQYSFMVSGMMLFMLFTLILANRINEETQKKLQAEEQLLEQQEAYTHRLEKDVQERTQKVNALLSEKEVLLREVYHRVKNNFHMVTSLLWIEYENQKAQNQKSSLLELINRIKSMALIHQYLLSSDDYSAISSKEYIGHIVMEIQKSYPKKSLEIQQSIDTFNLTPDQALYLGVVINELMTNSIKHYKSDGVCTINIVCERSNNQVILKLSDNGEGFDYESAQYSSFGLQLIEEFSEKLEPIESGFVFEGETHYTLTFEM